MKKYLPYLLVFGATTSIIAIVMSTKTKTYRFPNLTGKLRGCDPKGCGHFGAPRGSRKHNGVDFATKPGDVIVAPVSGRVSRLPFAQADMLFRGVEIISGDEKHQIFYLNPTVKIGTNVVAGQVIGTAANIQTKYGTSMVNHVHHEIEVNGKYINPEKLYV